jgi:hypothetical protein
LKHEDTYELLSIVIILLRRRMAPAATMGVGKR